MISRQGELRCLSGKEEKEKLTILLYHTGKASHFRRANGTISRNHFIIGTTQPQKLKIETSQVV